MRIIITNSHIDTQTGVDTKYTHRTTKTQYEKITEKRKRKMFRIRPVVCLDALSLCGGRERCKLCVFFSPLPLLC